MKKKYIYFVLIFILFFTFGIFIFSTFGQNIQQILFGHKEISVPTGGIAINEKPKKCNAGDQACDANNTRIEANNIQGNAAIYARHQCDGPRACPTPEPDVAQAAIIAIQSFAKNPHLTLTRINGVNSAGIISYCAKDTRCWSYNTKNKNVEEIKTESIKPVVSPSPQQK